MKLINAPWPYFTIGLLSLSLFACQSGQKPSKSVTAVPDSSNRQTFVAYLQDNTIMIQSDSTTVPVKVQDNSKLQAMDPAVDPEGQHIAYTRIMTNNDIRTIDLMDLSTQKRNPLEVPSQNFYGPVWSIDGKWIAFNIFQKNNVWKIGVINRNNQGYRMLDSTSNINYYSPTWRTGDRIVAQDLKKLYTLSLDGKILETIPLDSLIGKDFSHSSDDKYYFTKDQKNIVFKTGTLEEVPELMGTLQSVYRIRLSDKKITRLTPSNINIRKLFIANDDRIFYEGAKTPFDVYELYELLPSGDFRQRSKSGVVMNTTSKDH